MLVAEDHPAGKNSTPPLKSEGPLSEKDEQAQAVERSRSLQKEALEKWSHLKGKIGKFIHPKKLRDVK